MNLHRRVFLQAILAACLILSCLGLAQPAKAQPALYDNWLNAGSMATGRVYHTATLLADGRVLVVGGADNEISSTYLASAELYNPATNSWSSAGNMSTGRGYHSATLLPDGRVLVAGGRSLDYVGYALASAEIFNPAANSWSAAAPMPQPHEMQTAILLPTGKVMVVCSTYNIYSTLLYDPVNDSWSPAAEPPAACTQALLLQNGHVLAFYATTSSASTIVENYDPSTNTWSQGASLGMTFSTSPAFALLPNNRVLAIGAVEAEIYNSEANTWSPAASMVIYTHLYKYTATSLPDGRVLVAGGEAIPPYAAATGAELYDPVSDTWTPTWQLAMGRYWQAATSLQDGRVLVTGGINVVQAEKSAEMYQAPVGAWRLTGKMATDRGRGPAALLLNGKVLVAGGRDSSQNETTHAELYDPSSDTWSAAAPMPAARAFSTATRLLDGRVLVAGGSYTNQVQFDSYLYNPATNSWLPGGPLVFKRSEATAVLLANGKVLLIGGYNDLTDLTSVELYNPATNKWSAVPSLPASRYGLTATLLPNGKVLVAGGYHNSGAVASTLLFNPANNSWSAGPSMATARCYHSATLLRDGRVLVAGGTNNTVVLSNAEIYNPLSNSWSPAANMPLSRASHSATLLMDGRVILAGGYQSSAYSDILPGRAEIYDPLTNAWVLTANMLAARTVLNITLLANGRALVTGGFMQNDMSVPDAEYFDLPVRFAYSAYIPLIVR